MTPASVVSVRFSRFAGFPPDTQWPPDLQNVSQGQFGREAGRGAALQTPRRCKWCTAASHSALHGTFSKTQSHCPARLSNAISQCRTLNLCCAAVCHCKCTSASVEPDLKVTPAKVLFYKPTSLDSTCSLCPRTAGRHFVQHSRLCPPAGCAQAAAAAAGSMEWKTLDHGLKDSSSGSRRLGRLNKTYIFSWNLLTVPWLSLERGVSVAASGRQFPVCSVETL